MKKIIATAGLAFGLSSGLFASASFAEGHEADAPRALSPATPYEFAEQYGAASASMSAEAVASYYSDSVLSIPFKGESTTRTGSAVNIAALTGLFSGLKERGVSSLRLTDHTITQLSNHFATVRMRWELSDTDGQIKNTVMSTYVIRLEEPGWRVVTILEMGSPHGP